VNCFQVRRHLLTSPRAHADGQDAHLETCAECARLAARIDKLDREIGDAALVPPPAGLAHRVLLGREARPTWRYAAAAVLLAVSVSAALVLPKLIDAFEFAGTAEAVGPAHPGVAAISLIADSVLNARQMGDPAEIDLSLKRLGLTLGKADATTYYVGKCHMAGGNCDHLRLSTPEGDADVLLLSEYPVTRQVLVTDRRMTALVNPAPHGGYIVVAQTRELVKRTYRLFRRG